MFARFGIPGRVVSDSGPQFSEEEVLRFANEWELCRVKTSSNYPHVNKLVLCQQSEGR